MLPRSETGDLCVIDVPAAIIYISFFIAGDVICIIRNSAALVPSGWLYLNLKRKVSMLVGCQVSVEWSAPLTSGRIRGGNGWISTSFTSEARLWKRRRWQHVHVPAQVFVSSLFVNLFFFLCAWLPLLPDVFIVFCSTKLQLNAYYGKKLISFHWDFAAKST